MPSAKRCRSGKEEGSRPRSLPEESKKIPKLEDLNGAATEEKELVYRMKRELQSERRAEAQNEA